MTIWGIEEEHRSEVEDILKNTSPKHIGLALANMAAACADEEFAEANDIWMETYLPEIRFA